MKRPEWLPVARWEILRMVRRADFVISVLMVPLLMVGGGFLLRMLKARSDAERHTVALVAPPGESFPAPPRVTWLVPPDTGDAALRELVREGRADAAVRVPPGWTRGESLEVLVRRGTPGWVGGVRDHFAEQARLRRAAARGVDSTTLASFDRALAWSERSVVPAGTSRGDRIVAFTILGLLTFSVFMTGAYMAIGISGEKQQRVTEVVVSAVRPEAWMDGKIAAYSAIGLLQALLWGLSFLAIAGPAVPSLGARIDPLLIAMVLGFAGVGFVQYCALFALVMATVKDLQSTQKIQAYLFFVPMVPFLFADAVLKTPDAPWVMAVSQVPLFSPMLMPMRMMVGAAQTWELALGLALLAGSALLFRRAAGAAFRIGMLMYGKELTLPELWRWSRER